MSGRESTVDGDHPVRGFWHELDRLRRERGMSYKQLERATNVPASTLHYWMARSGRLMPWSQVRPVVLALGAPEQAWFDRWKLADRGCEQLSRAERCGDPGDVAPAGTGARATAAAVAARAQLPMDIREFTGREAELRYLYRMLLPAEGETAMAVSLITGMAGVGKTRLAVRMAHHLKRRFQYDDVQLYVDLRGHSAGQGPADPGAVLEAFIRLLGVPGSDIPRDLEARAAMYRDRLDNRRAVVLLDNAANEQQVRPLLPGSPTCRVLITSRRTLAGLDGVQPLSLDRFSPAEALAQLAGVVGTDRVAAEPDAAAEITRRCGYLPLAISLAARRLRARPAWTLADLNRRLATEAHRLSELAVSDQAIRTVFDLSYGHLPAAHRRIFHLLGLHPGDDFTAHSAAALADITPGHADHVLETLLDEHLLEQTTAGRYRFHDLVHAYARQRAEEQESAADRGAAVRRVLSWYLHNADRADRVLAPHYRRLPLPVAAPSGLLGFHTHEQALGWCEAERVNLVAAIRQATDHHLDHIAWRLTAALFSFFNLRKHWDDWISTYQAAVKAAQRSNDDPGRAWIIDGLAIAYCDVHRFTESIACFREALAIHRRIGDRLGEGQVLNNLGEAHRYLGRFDDAIEHYQQSLEIFRELEYGDREGIGVNNLGKAYRAVNRLQESLECHLHALDLSSKGVDRYTRAEILNDIGEAYSSLGQFERAIDYYRQTLTLRHDLGDRYGEAETLHNLGHAFQASDRNSEAVSHYHQAVTIRRELGDKWGLARSLDRLQHLLVLADK